VIIRHGEKQKISDNLTCQGENRARQLRAVLFRKFGKPSYSYVPALGLGESTVHARMFQTISPFAIKHDLSINSSFPGDDYSRIARSVLEKSGTVLMVWNHTFIPPLAEALGVKNPPRWADNDFDSIWIITYPQGKAVLSIDNESISPALDCIE